MRGALARALPSVQVTWHLWAVPETPSVPGIGELGARWLQAHPAPAWPTLPPWRTLHTYQPWQGLWLACSLPLAQLLACPSCYKMEVPTTPVLPAGIKK